MSNFGDVPFIKEEFSFGEGSDDGDLGYPPCVCGLESDLKIRITKIPQNKHNPLGGPLPPAELTGSIEHRIDVRCKPQRRNIKKNDSDADDETLNVHWDPFQATIWIMYKRRKDCGTCIYPPGTDCKEVPHKFVCKVGWVISGSELQMGAIGDLWSMKDVIVLKHNRGVVRELCLKLLDELIDGPCANRDLPCELTVKYKDMCKPDFVRSDA